VIEDRGVTQVMGGHRCGLAETVRLYLDLTGLGCYHKKDVPAWYDKLSENDRWDAQGRFCEAVAGRCDPLGLTFGSVQAEAAGIRNPRYRPPHCRP
jgi:hypothetical protein